MFVFTHYYDYYTILYYTIYTILYYILYYITILLYYTMIITIPIHCQLIISRVYLPAMVKKTLILRNRLLNHQPGPVFIISDSRMRAKSVVVKCTDPSSAIGMFIRTSFCNNTKWMPVYVYMRVYLQVRVMRVVRVVRALCAVVRRKRLICIFGRHVRHISINRTIHQWHARPVCWYKIFPLSN